MNGLYSSYLFVTAVTAPALLLIKLIWFIYIDCLSLFLDDELYIYIYISLFLFRDVYIYIYIYLSLSL